jgi:hypothetical protein
MMVSRKQTGDQQNLNTWKNSSQDLPTQLSRLGGAEQLPQDRLSVLLNEGRNKMIFRTVKPSVNANF